MINLALKFTKPEVKKYLDKQIKFYRKQRDKHISKREKFRNIPYLLACEATLQQVRVALFGVKLK